MAILQHLKAQPFVVATGTSALLHSTWTLGTLFSGPQPAIESITSIIGLVHFIGWLVPAFLIAFSLDIGQIATSHEIRMHGLTPMRGITFGVLAVSTYYLQYLFLVHHLPAMPLSAGIADTHRQAAQFMSDLSLWLLPALLPLSTLLYTFAGQDTQKQQDTVPAIQQIQVAHNGNGHYHDSSEGVLVNPTKALLQNGAQSTTSSSEN